MNGWLLALLIVALLVAGVSASAETALTSVSRIRIRSRSAAGDKGAARVEQLHKNPSAYLGTILVANTLSVTLAASAATLLAEERLGAGAAVWSAVALAIVVLLFFELGPKTYALQHNETLAGHLARLVGVATLVLSPVVTVLTAISALFFRVLPGEGGRRAPFLTEQELKELVAASEQEGVVEEEEREMIQGVLEMTDKPVREVMLPRIQMVALADDTAIEDAVAEILDHGHSRIPVYEETVDNITGVLYAKDLLGAGRGPGPRPATVGEVARAATFVPASKRLGELLQEMQSKNVHLAIVVDEYGGTAGMVTIEDLLEEIVGPIRDEYDASEPEEVQLVNPNEALISASTGLDDVNELLHLNLAGDGFDSIGGLVYARLGRIPNVGDSVEEGGVRITVEAIERRSIKTVRLHSDSALEPVPELAGHAASEEGGGGAPGSD